MATPASHARGLPLCRFRRSAKLDTYPVAANSETPRKLPSLRGRAWYKIRKLRKMYQSLMRKIRKLRELRSGKYPEIPNSAHPRTVIGHICWSGIYPKSGENSRPPASHAPKKRGAVCRFKAMNNRRRYCCTRQPLRRAHTITL